MMRTLILLAATAFETSGIVAVLDASRWRRTVATFPDQRRQVLMYAKNTSCVAVCHTGIGSMAIDETITLLFELFPRPMGIVHMGFAGAVTSSLSVGSVVYPSYAYDERSHERLPLLFDYDCIPRNACAGDIMTVYGPCDAKEKRSIAAQQPGITAVDMESFHIVRACRSRYIPVAICKTISDDVSFQLPRRNAVPVWLSTHATVAKKIEKSFDSNLSLLDMLRAYRLYRNCVHAGEKLTQTLIPYIHQWSQEVVC